MANTYQPLNQEQRISPYYQRLFQFDTTDSRIYVSRVANTLMSCFTLAEDVDSTTLADTTSYAIIEDGILDGFNTSYSLDGNTITVTVQPGMAIQDLTQIYIEDSVDLELDLTPYDDSGFLALAINYNFLNQINSNPALYKLEYVTADGSGIYPDGWNLFRDRIVVTYFNFTKTAGTVTSVTNNCSIPTVHAYTNPLEVVIDNYEYDVGAPLKFIKNILAIGSTKVYPYNLYDGDTTYTYDVDGDITLVSKDLPNGTFTQTFTYNAEGDVSTILYQLDGANHSKKTFIYNDDGDVTGYTYTEY